MRLPFHICLLIFLLLAFSTRADSGGNHEPRIAGTQKFIYKQVDGFDLPVFVFTPETEASHKRRGAVVFFHGSGWMAGSVRQFETQARLLSDHGLVAVLAEYRVKEGYNATPFDGIRDAKSVIRWLRTNADRFNVDPDRIAAAGASAGGHIALAASIFKERFNDELEDMSATAIPDALILFSTVVDTTSDGYNDEEGLSLFMGEGKKYSPARNLKKDMPPVIIMHGTADEWIPYASIERFAKDMRALGNACELIPFLDRGHHFYNSAAYLAQRPHLRTQTSRMDFVMSFYLMERFLFNQGILESRPAIMSLDSAERIPEIRGSRRE
ncbi:MAG: alpha/beta hydrolase [Gammaproteobacteria bacterium]